MNIYFLQSHKLNFLKHSYFYKLVCMFSEDSDQPAHPHCLISLHHMLYKINCFFVQTAQTDHVAEMHRLILVFTERTCYFAEINVFLSLVPGKHCEILFPLYIVVFYNITCFPAHSIINHYLLKAEGHYYYTLNCCERKMNKDFFFFFLFFP